MSTWFSQSIVYGYKTTYEKFAEIVDVDDFNAYDNAMAENREDKIGWVVDDGYAIYGKILLEGEDAGNDSVFAAESLVVEVPQFEDINDIIHIQGKIELLFEDTKPSDVKFYIAGHYS